MPRDIAGYVYGAWTVLHFAGCDRHRRSLWVCRCACTVVRPILEYDLITGMSTQCLSCAARKREARRRQEREGMNPKSEEETVETLATDAEEGIGLPTLKPGEEIAIPFSSTHPRAARELGQLISGD